MEVVRGSLLKNSLTKSGASSKFFFFNMGGWVSVTQHLFDKATGTLLIQILMVTANQEVQK